MPPTIAEALLGIASQTAQTQPDLAGSFSKGAELGLQAEQVAQKRQQLEQAKSENELKKFEVLGGWLNTYANMPEGGAKNAFGKKFVPNGIMSMGLQEKIHPNVIEMMTGDPVLGTFLTNEIRNRRLDIATLAQPDKIAEYYAEHGKQFGSLEEFKGGVEQFLPALSDAEKFSIDVSERMKRAELVQEGADARQQTGISSAGDVELSQAVNKDYKAYEVEGGGSNIDSNLALLREVEKSLSSDAVQTGGWKTYVPSDRLQKLGISDIVALENKAKKAIMSSLRATLGSQFTKEEGERVENRTFDKQLDTKHNLEAVRAEIKKIENTRRRAESLFSRYMKGYKTPTKKSFNQLAPAAQAIVIKQEMQRTGKSEVEVRKALGAK